MSRRNSTHEPPEVAALMNPAIIALVLSRCVTAYEAEGNKPFPFVLSPIVSAISLYPEARTSLTMTVSTHFGSWIERNPSLQTSLQSRILASVPFVQEAILFALSYDVLRIDSGGLRPGTSRPTKSLQGNTPEIIEMQKVARYLGRWFWRTDSPGFICAMLGVTA